MVELPLGGHSASIGITLKTHGNLVKILRISGDWQSPLLSPFLPIELLRCRRKEHITAAVEGGFDGVLNDTDDEADSDRLHGDIIADTEERASHRNEQQ